ncbi:unnamed protein product [Withania somnifera]
METDEEVEEQEIIELGNLSNYIVESIFFKIPLRFLVQLKTVSKTWRNSITNIRHSYPPTTSIGLVLFLRHKTYQESLFIKDRPNQKSFHSTCTHKDPFLIDSCNGVLLYASHNNFVSSSPFLYQFVTLTVSFSSCHKAGLFKSYSWSWRDTQIRILNTELLLVDGFVKGQCFNPSVFAAQKVYWIWSFMFVRLLWESGGGVIHFCDPVNSAFFIWTFRGDDFKFDHFVRLEKYYINDQYLRLKMGYPIKPFPFNKDLQVLYFHVLPHTIVAYSFETRELVQVWSYCCHEDEEEEDCWIFKIHPFLFSSVNLLAFNKLRQVD